MEKTEGKKNRDDIFTFSSLFPEWEAVQKWYQKTSTTVVVIALVGRDRAPAESTQLRTARAQAFTSDMSFFRSMRRRNNSWDWRPLNAIMNAAVILCVWPRETQTCVCVYVRVREGSLFHRGMPNNAREQRKKKTLLHMDKVRCSAILVQCSAMLVECSTTLIPWSAMLLQCSAAPCWYSAAPCSYGAAQCQCDAAQYQCSEILIQFRLRHSHMLQLRSDATIWGSHFGTVKVLN